MGETPLKRYVFDTNALMVNPFYLESINGEITIPFVVLSELDKIKMEHQTSRGFQARQAVRVLKSMGNKITYDFDRVNELSNLYINNDDLIIQFAKKTNSILVTGDYLAQLKSNAVGVESIALDEVKNADGHLSYSGIKELYLDLTDEEDCKHLSLIYEGKVNLDMKRNQYLAMWDSSRPTFDYDGKLTGYEPIDQLKWNGERLTKLSFKKIDNVYTGKVTPVNVKQHFAFDMLQDKNTSIKAMFGGFGVGKDYLMISHAIDLLMNSKSRVDKLIWVRNNIEVRDTEPIGFLPSDMDSKLLPWLMPLADHLGGVDGLKGLMMQGKIEAQHMGFIRGRDIKNSILYCTEVENSTKEHVQLLIGRIGDGSQLWCNGDTKQIDRDKFTFNNGVNSLKKLGGQELYGQVTLDKTERSDTARLADLLD